MTRFLRFPIVFLSIALLLFGASKIVRLSPDWPVWLVALVVAAVAELILFLYRYESGAISPRRAKWVVALRLAALGLLTWILIEPVWVRKVAKNLQRQVVVVLDDSASMHLKDDGMEQTRQQIGEAALAESKILEKLGEKLKVRTVRAARSVRTHQETASEGWSDATDLATALGTVLEQVPPDELAGVLMVTDGRHNRPERVEDIARRFGILDAPVGTIATGSAIPPRDASIVSVKAPEAIHLGDKMRVTVEAKFDGYKGQRAKVSLKRGDHLLEEREIPIPQDHHREEIRFAQVPEEGGVGDYKIEISGLEGERFPDNNAWEFETSITDARTHVLIVEGHPRWEFRYLRNLFYGRDKSVHLQYVLLHPDRIDGQQDDDVAASASRPFGDAQATRLPESEAEWKKFDVIILGDIAPKAIDDKTWQTISRCVNERAALLVMAAGPRYMPHSIASEAGKSLVPAEMEWGNRTYFNTEGNPFSFELTSEGQRNPITQQSNSQTSNHQIWSGFPDINWRHPVASLKEGAEVLLTAALVADTRQVTGGANLENALDAIAQRREREAKAALLVTRQTGKGKVALLLTDRTWRLREGAGDLYHHRFWGNLVRWGAGPTLRSGGERARLGTDQLTYTPDDKIKLTARLRDDNLNPVDDDSLQADVFLDEKKITTVPLKPIENSNGLYEAELKSFDRSGRYEVSVRGGKAAALIRQDGIEKLTTKFRVVGSRGPIELAETTLNLPLLETIAQLSGGKVVLPHQAADLTSLFLTDKDERLEVRETSLWDTGWILALLAIVLSAEWITRRAGGLP
jgi:hypothetical protein